MLMMGAYSKELSSTMTTTRFLVLVRFMLMIVFSLSGGTFCATTTNDQWLTSYRPSAERLEKDGGEPQATSHLFTVARATSNHSIPIAELQEDGIRENSISTSYHHHHHYNYYSKPTVPSTIDHGVAYTTTTNEYKGDPEKFTTASPASSSSNNKMQLLTDDVGGGGEKLLLDDELTNEIEKKSIKMYERVVLEGTHIRISCPHSNVPTKLTTTPTIKRRNKLFFHSNHPTLTKVQKNNNLAAPSTGAVKSSSSSFSSSSSPLSVASLVYNEEKQFVDVEQNETLARPHTTVAATAENPVFTTGVTTSSLEEEAEEEPVVVKWFRNHEPLLNVNYVQHAKQLEAASSSSLTNAHWRQLEAPLILRQTTINITELKRSPLEEQEVQQASEEGLATVEFYQTPADVEAGETMSRFPLQSPLSSLVTSKSDNNNRQGLPSNIQTYSTGDEAERLNLLTKATHSSHHHHQYQHPTRSKRRMTTPTQHAIASKLVMQQQQEPQLVAVAGSSSEALVLRSENANEQHTTPDSKGQVRKFSKMLEASSHGQASLARDVSDYYEKNSYDNDDPTAILTHYTENDEKPSQLARDDMTAEALAGPHTRAEFTVEKNDPQNGEVVDDTGWEVNEFGELVINGVSKRFAGIYSCSSRGQISEVLLDVLEKNRPEVEQENHTASSSEVVSGAVGVKRKYKRAELGDQIIQRDSSFNQERNENDAVELSSDASSKQQAESFSAGTTSAPILPLSEMPLSIAQVDSISQYPLNHSDAFARSASALASEKSQSRPSSAPSHLKSASEESVKEAALASRNSLAADSENLINTSPLVVSRDDNVNERTMSHLKQKTTSRQMLLENNDDGKKERKKKNSMEQTTENRSERYPKLSPTLIPAPPPPPSLPPLLDLQKHPTHLVKSETILAKDFRSIPGFLFTKHRLYCPLAMTLNDFNQAFVQPIVQKLCATANKLTRTVRNSSSGIMKSIKSKKAVRGSICHSLAKKFIHKLIVIYHTEWLQENACSSENRLFELNWFKDGNKLEFEQDSGKAKGINFNLRAITDMVDHQFSTKSTLETWTRDRNDEKLKQSTKKREKRNGSNVDSASSVNEVEEEEEKDDVENQTISEETITASTNPLFVSPLDAISSTDCPLKGIALELDGVKKDSAGRYTCALSFHFSKLLRIIILKLDEQTHRQQQHSRDSVNLRAASLISPISAELVTTGRRCSPSSTDNDGLCHDNGDKPAPNVVTSDSDTKKEEKGSAFLNQKEAIGYFLSPPFETQSNDKEVAPEMDETKKSVSELEHKKILVSEGLRDWLKLSEQVTMLSGEISKNQSVNLERLDYVVKIFNKLQDPATTIQSFSLMVSERSANSSDLWSTIMEATNAYTRRKLDDFRRLKRSSSAAATQRQRYRAGQFLNTKDATTTTSASFVPLEPLNGAINDNYNVYNDDNGETPSTRSEQRLLRRCKRHIRRHDDETTTNRVHRSWWQQQWMADHDDNTKIHPNNNNNNNDDKQPGRQVKGDSSSRVDELDTNSMLRDNQNRLDESDYRAAFKVDNLDEEKKVEAAARRGSSQLHLTSTQQTSSAPDSWSNYANEMNQLEPRGYYHHYEDENTYKDNNDDVADAEEEEATVATTADESKDDDDDDDDDDDEDDQDDAAPSVSAGSSGLAERRRPTTKMRTEKSITWSGQQKQQQPPNARLIGGVGGATLSEDVDFSSSVLTTTTSTLPSSNNALHHAHPVSASNWSPLIDGSSEPFMRSERPSAHSPPLGQTFEPPSSSSSGGGGAVVPSLTPIRQHDDSDNFGDEEGEVHVRASANADKEDVQAREQKLFKATAAASLTGDKLRIRRTSKWTRRPASGTIEPTASAGRHLILQRQRRKPPSTDSPLSSFATAESHSSPPIGSTGEQNQAPSSHHLLIVSNDKEAGSTKHSSENQPLSERMSMITNGDRDETEANSSLHHGKLAQAAAKSGAGQEELANATVTTLSAPLSPATVAVAAEQEDGQSESVELEDESLMWSASQYLYMHMQALASSSLFGVQVGVEWSNERAANRSTGAINSMMAPDRAAHQNQQTPLVGGSYAVDVATTTTANVDTASDASDEPTAYARYSRARTPFATLDVIPGQSLHLQCTAHALGRLSEVKWYKLIHKLPPKLDEMLVNNTLKRIGSDLYWPLAELDLLDEHSTLTTARERRFVCSQTTSIFDNLINQTFTVITSLHLSQYNDIPETLHTQEAPNLSATTNNLDSEQNYDYNLYACIVDADVRHNYATLGVHFRRPAQLMAAKMMPLELSKRLFARRSILANGLERDTPVQSVIRVPPSPTPPILTSSDVESKNSAITNKSNGLQLHQQQQPKYDLYRENSMQTVPLGGLWVPIKMHLSEIPNKFYQHRQQETIAGELPLAPAALVSIIVVVLGSLIGLVLLTLRSYKALTQLHLEEENHYSESQPPPLDELHANEQDNNNNNLHEHELNEWYQQQHDNYQLIDENSLPIKQMSPPVVSSTSSSSSGAVVQVSDVVSSSNLKASIVEQKYYQRNLFSRGIFGTQPASCYLTEQEEDVDEEEENFALFEKQLIIMSNGGGSIRRVGDQQPNKPLYGAHIHNIEVTHNCNCHQAAAFSQLIQGHTTDFSSPFADDSLCVFAQNDQVMIEGNKEFEGFEQKYCSTNETNCSSNESSSASLTQVQPNKIPSTDYENNLKVRMVENPFWGM